MKDKRVVITTAIILIIIGSVIVSQVLEKRYDARFTRVFLPPVDNPLYEAECASCHFLYLPGLLPAGSWTRVVDGSQRHFGHELGLSDKVREELKAYLVANAAETTGAKRSGRILDSLKGATPLRITETPYIDKKHKAIKKIIYGREAIMSFSNCIACHKTATEGNFKEANVKIPR